MSEPFDRLAWAHAMFICEFYMDRSYSILHANLDRFFFFDFYCTYLLFHQFFDGDGLLFLLLFLFLLLEDEPGRQGVAVDTLVPVGTVPEPTVDALLYGVKEVLTHLQNCKS